MNPLAALLLLGGYVLLFVLLVSFMFRALGLLREIRDGLNRIEEKTPEPLHEDPDIAAHLARKRGR